MQANLLRIWLAAAALLASSGAAAGERVPLPTLPAAQGEQCVEPTDDIRRNHMRYLMHQRDDTVHQGIRTTRHSLKKCIACHATRDERGDYRPVNAPGEFCQSCHSYAAVSMDCFQCHATRPEADAARGNGARIGAPGDGALLTDLQDAAASPERRAP